MHVLQPLGANQQLIGLLVSCGHNLQKIQCLSPKRNKRSTQRNQLFQYLLQGTSQPLLLRKQNKKKNKSSLSFRSIIFVRESPYNLKQFPQEPIGIVFEQFEFGTQPPGGLVEHKSDGSLENWENDDGPIPWRKLYRNKI
jgi:hypothetical protein